MIAVDSILTKIETADFSKGLNADRLRELKGMVLSVSELDAEGCFRGEDARAEYEAIGKRIFPWMLEVYRNSKGFTEGVSNN